MNRRSYFRWSVLAGALLFAWLAPAQSGSWTAKAPLPVARDALATVALEGKIYAMGGWDGARIGVYTSLVHVYDAAPNSWSAGTELPTPLMGFGATALGGRIHVAGGLLGAQLVTRLAEQHFAYDPQTGQWTERASLPFGNTRAFPAAAAVRDKFYLLGGLVDPAGLPLALHDVYDPQTNTWAAVKALPLPRGGATAVVVEGKIYLIGGISGRLNDFTPLALNEVYEPASDTWQVLQSAPEPIGGGAGAVVVGTKIYIIGGDISKEQCWIPTDGHRHQPREKMLIYDIPSDTWTTADGPKTARAYLGATLIGKTIYAIGGGTNAPRRCGISDAVEALQLP